MCPILIARGNMRMQNGVGGFTYQLALEITNYHYDHAMNVCYMRSES